MTHPPDGGPCAVGRDFTASNTDDDLDWTNPCPHPSTAWLVYQKVSMRVCTCHAAAIEANYREQMEEKAASIERARPWN